VEKQGNPNGYEYSRGNKAGRGFWLTPGWFD
jgi:hypothetical protein